MKITSLDHRSSMTFEVIENEFLYSPSITLAISVSDEGFSGSCKSLGIGLDDFRNFMSQLLICEKERQGSAQISSMSPVGLELRFESYDSWGHFLVHYVVGKYIPFSPFTRTVSGVFEIDPSDWPQIISEFEDMLLPFMNIQ